MTRQYPCPARSATTSVGAAAEIKQKLDIVDFINESVPLKKAGTTFKGLCPFHGEKTPSFVVTPSRESWHCFGCGKGGDIFNFIMERESIDFPEALRRLAPRAGVELSERTSREDALRKRLRDVLETAISFYHVVLTSHPSGQPALDYLRSRGFTDTTIQDFQLGFAPDSWDALSRQLAKKRQVTIEDLEGAGLVTRRPSRSGVYDRFRNRIIFPIRDFSGGATGLGGRIVGKAEDGRDQGPKYLNSPATLLFDKSRTLYLIDKAKGAMRKQGRAVLVEGNTDALMAHQQGFDNVVGSLGTALTAGQVELATKYAPRIALAYDVDSAGQDAATFGATELTALVGEIERSPHRGRLTDVDVVRLPDGRDPDEVIRDDPDVWRKATEEPEPIMEFLIDRYAKRFDQRIGGNKDRLVDALAPTLRSVTDPVRLDGYLLTLSKRIGVEVSVLKEKLRRPAPVQTGGGQRDGAQAGARINLEAILSTPGALDPQAVERALEPAETSLLHLLLVRPELVPIAEERLQGGDIVTTLARELWLSLVHDAGAVRAATFDRQAFLDGLDPTIEGVARTLLARTDPLPDDPIALAQSLEQSLLTLERNRLNEALEFKRAELAEAEAASETSVVDQLQQDVLELQQRRLELDRERANATVLSKRRPHANATRTPTPTGGPA